MTVKKEEQEYFSEEYFAETNETELVIADEDGNKPAVVIHGYTKASKEWEEAKSRYKVRDEVKINGAQEMIVNLSLSLNEKKALAMIVTKITGMGKDDLTGDAVKKLFVNPVLRKIPAKLDSHLNTLGNEKED